MYKSSSILKIAWHDWSKNIISIYLSCPFGYILLTSWKIKNSPTISWGDLSSLIINVLKLKNSLVLGLSIFFLIFRGHNSFLYRHSYPCFGFLVMPALGFKARVDSLLTCFLIYVQQIPQIQIWCDTCLPLSGQHGSQVFLIHIPGINLINFFSQVTKEKMAEHQN